MRRFGSTAAHITSESETTEDLSVLSLVRPVVGTRGNLIPTFHDADRGDLIPTRTGLSKRLREQEAPSCRPSEGERVRKPEIAPSSNSRSSDRQEVGEGAPAGAPAAGAVGFPPDFLSEAGPRERFRRPPPEDAGAAGAVSGLNLHASPYVHEPVVFHV